MSEPIYSHGSFNKTNTQSNVVSSSGIDGDCGDMEMKDININSKNHDITMTSDYKAPPPKQSYFKDDTLPVDSNMLKFSTGPIASDVEAFSSSLESNLSNKSSMTMSNVVGTNMTDNDDGNERKLEQVNEDYGINLLKYILIKCGICSEEELKDKNSFQLQSMVQSGRKYGDDELKKMIDDRECEYLRTTLNTVGRYPLQDIRYWGLERLRASVEDLFSTPQRIKELKREFEQNRVTITRRRSHNIHTASKRSERRLSSGNNNVNYGRNNNNNNETDSKDNNGSMSIGLNGRKKVLIWKLLRFKGTDLCELENQTIEQLEKLLKSMESCDINNVDNSPDIDMNVTSMGGVLNGNADDFEYESLLAKCLSLGLQVNRGMSYKDLKRIKNIHLLNITKTRLENGDDIDIDIDMDTM